MSAIFHNLTPAQFGFVLGIILFLVAIGVGLGLGFAIWKGSNADYMRGVVDAENRIAPRLMRLEKDNDTLRRQLRFISSELRDSKRANGQLKVAFDLIGKGHLVDAVLLETKHVRNIG